MTEPVDIVLPCYNPNSTWPEELLNFDRFIRPAFPVSYIVVNDGSVSGDLEGQVKSLQEKQVPITLIGYPRNRGKGYALRQGVKAAKARYVLYTDVDFPFTNQSMENMLRKLTVGNNDIVAGFRNENYYEKTISTFRKRLSKSFRYFMRNFLRMPITDTQCGLKGFNGAGKKKFLETRIDRYLFDFEFIYVSVKDKSLRIEAVQVELKDNVVFSKMKARILMQETFNLLKVLVLRVH